MDFIIQKLSLINTAVRCAHFTFMTLIVFPLTTELAAVNPANYTVTVPLSSAPVSLVSCLFELVSV